MWGLRKLLDLFSSGLLTRTRGERHLPRGIHGSPTQARAGARTARGSAGPQAPGASGSPPRTVTFLCSPWLEADAESYGHLGARGPTGHRTTHGLYLSLSRWPDTGLWVVGLCLRGGELGGGREDTRRGEAAGTARPDPLASDGASVVPRALPRPQAPQQGVISASLHARGSQPGSDTGHGGISALPHSGPDHLELFPSALGSDLQALLRLPTTPCLTVPLSAAVWRSSTPPVPAIWSLCGCPRAPRTLKKPAGRQGLGGCISA